MLALNIDNINFSYIGQDVVYKLFYDICLISVHLSNNEIKFIEQCNELYKFIDQNKNFMFYPSLNYSILNFYSFLNRSRKFGKTEN